MKIKEIKQESYNVFEVTFIPNWLEKLFGIKETTKKYGDSGMQYTFYGTTVYIDKQGNKLGPNNWISEEIDKFRRSW